MTGAEPPSAGNEPRRENESTPGPGGPHAAAQLREREAQGGRRDLLLGLASMVVLAAGESAFVWIYHPPGREPLVTIGVLLGSAVLALLLGTLALSAGPRVGLRTIRRKMTFTASIGALYAFVNALVAAYLMFVTVQDVYVMMALLLFALLLSLTLVLALAGMIGRALAILTGAARRIARGRLDTLVLVESGDELAVLGTDLQRMAASLVEAQRMQRAVEDAQRDLMTNISHDLRTPLNALQAVASALADGLVAEEPATAAYYVRELDVQVARLAALIDDLFTLTRLEGSAPELARAPYPTADLLSGLLERAVPLASAAGVGLEVTVAAPTPAVLVDVRQIERVLDNLMQNALRHTPPGGMITVQAAPYGDAGTEVMMTVTDTGAGIDPSDLPMLFTRYYQGSGQARGASGAGLGLAIVKAVVQAHGGRVWAASPAPGLARGTQISLVLPAAADSSGGARADGERL